MHFVEYSYGGRGLLRTELNCFVVPRHDMQCTVTAEAVALHMLHVHGVHGVLDAEGFEFPYICVPVRWCCYRRLPRWFGQQAEPLPVVVVTASCIDAVGGDDSLRPRGFNSSSSPGQHSKALNKTLSLPRGLQFFFFFRPSTCEVILFRQIIRAPHGELQKTQGVYSTNIVAVVVRSSYKGVGRRGYRLPTPRGYTVRVVFT